MANSNLRIIFFLSFFFTIIIFLSQVYIFNTDIIIKEERYIDRTVAEERYYEKSILEKKINNLNNDKKIIEEKNNIKKENITEKYIEKIDQNIIQNNKKISFIYIPSNLKTLIEDYILNTKTCIDSSFLEKKINNISIEFHKNLIDVRGRMKNKKILLFGPEDMGKEETLSVFIHELGHYIDLYFFSSNDFIDKSNYFYNISWDNVKIIKNGQKSKDFISGYSMTNKYEDFAESFTYYVLHNKDFLEKSKKSDFLEKKYLFFKNYLFKNNEFYLTNFSKDKEIKDYYRDITKIKINLENFLQYLENNI